MKASACNRRSPGSVLALVFSLITLAGCHPAQLAMPARKISPTLTLTIPTIGNAVGEQPHHPRLLSLAFRPGQDQIAAGYSDGRVLLWDIAARNVVKQFDYGDDVGALVFSPDGKKLAATDGLFGSGRDKPGLIRIWDVDSGAVAMEFKGRIGSVTALAWSRGPRSLLAAAFGEERDIRVWDTATREPIEKLDARGESDVTIAFTDDGRYFYVGGLAEIYEVPANKSAHFALHALRQAGSVAVLPAIDQYVLVTPATQDHLFPLCVLRDCGHPAELWAAPLKWEAKGVSWYLPKEAGFSGPIAVICAEKKSLLALNSPSGSGAVLLWDAKANKLTGALVADKGSRLAATVFDTTGDRVAAADSAAGSIFLWDLNPVNAIGGATSNRPAE